MDTILEDPLRREVLLPVSAVRRLLQRCGMPGVAFHLNHPLECELLIPRRTIEGQREIHHVSLLRPHLVICYTYRLNNRLNAARGDELERGLDGLNYERRTFDCAQWLPFTAY